ncbi:MAG: 50S ribosomal protein L23 [Metamycoplasmataceae bacterium]
MNINEIIKYPVLSEKTYMQMEKNIYTFVVDKRATKIEVKKAVQFIFDVKVEKINIINVIKKRKKLGKYEGFKGAYKKAIITLHEGSIAIFPEEGIAKDPELKEQDKEIKKLKEISDVEKKAAEKIKKASENKKEK